jgi:hypothetical protein
MSVAFKDIEHEEQHGSEPFVNVGILFIDDNGRWFARREGTGFTAEGHGTPEQLETGLWVADMEYEQVRALASGLRGVTMRSDKWLKLSLGQIRTAFGLNAAPLNKSLPVVSNISHRVFRLCQEALRDNMSALGYAGPQEFRSTLDRSSSLGTAIAEVNGRAIAKTISSSDRVLNHFSKTYQAGMYVRSHRDPPEDHIDLYFHFPRLSYAKKITQAPVPSSSLWQFADRPDEQSCEDFIADIRATKRPAIYKMICQPGEVPAPEHVQVFANGLNTSLGDTHRTRFIAEEVDILSRHYDLQIEGVVAGVEWQPSPTGVLIRSLEAKGGGPGAAHASWSLGLAAENILASATRTIKKKDPPWQTSEAIWIAARDRAAMMPALDALVDVGASLVSAHYGNITVRCPVDPEILMMMVNAAWENGLILPLESVELLQRMGIPIPVEQSLFGGNDVDYLLSAVVHRRQRNALWALDEIMDLPENERSARFKALIN